MRFKISSSDTRSQPLKVQTIDINISKADEEFVQLLDGLSSPPSLQFLVSNAWNGLKKQRAPKLCQEGVGGTYFMHDEAEQIIGIFKPQDEEPFCVNNPKGFTPKSGQANGFKEGIQGGESSIREVAAYLLDYNNFSGVPPTDLVVCQHPAFYSNGDTTEFPLLQRTESSLKMDLDEESSPKAKLGSFQQFINHHGDCEELDPNIIAQFPVHEVHKIAVLDIRIFNCDRHGGNILYHIDTNDRTGEDLYSLIPIDHGYSLPSSLQDPWFVWKSWPQAKEKMSEQTKNYIRALDAEKDIQLLKNRFEGRFGEEHFQILRITTLLLKKAVETDLTFFDLATMICRRHINEPSDLERIVKEANEKPRQNFADFLKIISSLLDEYLLDTQLTYLEFV